MSFSVYTLDGCTVSISQTCKVGRLVCSGTSFMPSSPKEADKRYVSQRRLNKRKSCSTKSMNTCCFRSSEARVPPPSNSGTRVALNPDLTISYITHSSNQHTMPCVAGITVRCVTLSRRTVPYRTAPHRAGSFHTLHYNAVHYATLPYNTSDQHTPHYMCLTTHPLSLP